jgi:hypothetical protein
VSTAQPPGSQAAAQSPAAQRTDWCENAHTVRPGEESAQMFCQKTQPWPCLGTRALTCQEGGTGHGVREFPEYFTAFHIFGMK